MSFRVRLERVREGMNLSEYWAEEERESWLEFRDDSTLKEESMSAEL